MATGEAIRVVQNGQAVVQKWALADVADHSVPEGAYLWIDLVDPDRDTVHRIKQHFSLHRLAVEAVFEHRKRPGVSIFERSAYVQLQHVSRQDSKVRSVPIKVFIGPGYFITIRPGYHFPVERILDRWDAAPDAWQMHTSSLLYALADVLVDDLARVTDELEDLLCSDDRYGIQMGRAGAPGSSVLESLYEITDQVSDAYAIALPLRDTIQSLLGDADVLGESSGAAYFRDVSDHAEYVADRLDNLQNLGQRIFDMAGALINLRLSDVSKQLTVVATIFLPLTFITGYFGQNFSHMVGAVNSQGAFIVYGIVLQVVSLVVILAVLFWLKAFR